MLCKFPAPGIKQSQKKEISLSWMLLTYLSLCRAKLDMIFFDLEVFFKMKGAELSLQIVVIEIELAVDGNNVKLAFTAVMKNNRWILA
jgi:hypothetical protein